MSGIVYVVAGNYEQACVAMRERGLSRDQWHYIASAQGLLGLRGVEVDLVGTVWERSDYDDILEAVERAK